MKHPQTKAERLYINEQKKKKRTEGRRVKAVSDEFDDTVLSDFEGK